MFPQMPPSSSNLDSEMPKTDTSTFSEWCRMTTLNGVHDFYYAKHIALKTLWFFIVITGCFIAVNQCTDFILSYVLEDEWVTNVYRKFPSADEFEWPHLRICYKNRIDGFDRTRLDHKIDPYEYAFISGRDEGVRFYNQFQDDNSRNNKSLGMILWEARTEALRDETILFTETWQDICGRTVVHCGPNDGFGFEIGCNCSLFMVPSSYRDCFVLSLPEIQKYHLGYQDSGYEYGLMLLLNPRTNKYRDEILYTDKLSAALNFYIHFDGEENGRYNRPILAGAGMHMLISMRVELHKTSPSRTYTFQFYQPPSRCVQKFQYKWLNATESSRTLCRHDCYTEFAITHCRCVSSISPVPLKADVRECTEMEDYFCQRDIKISRNNDTTLPSGFNLNQCFDGCHEPCEHREIGTDISVGPFPVEKKVKAFTKYLNKALNSETNFTEDDVKQMTLVELFIATKEYVVMERVPRITLEGLISDIGGTMAVWTGLSLIGVFQAFMYVLYGIRSVIRCRRKSKKLVNDTSTINDI